MRKDWRLVSRETIKSRTLIIGRARFISELISVCFEETQWIEISSVMYGGTVNGPNFGSCLSYWHPFPVYFLALDLPKHIVNGPIQGQGFDGPDARATILEMIIPLPAFCRRRFIYDF